MTVVDCSALAGVSTIIVVVSRAAARRVRRRRDDVELPLSPGAVFCVLGRLFAGFNGATMAKPKQSARPSGGKSGNEKSRSEVTQLEARRLQAHERRRAAKKQAKEARKLMKEAKKVAKRAKQELQSLSKKLRQLMGAAAQSIVGGAAVAKPRKKRSGGKRKSAAVKSASRKAPGRKAAPRKSGAAAVVAPVPDELVKE